MVHKILVGNLESRHSEDLEGDRMIILNWMSGEQIVKM
jgi:hypothetical protein